MNVPVFVPTENPEYTPDHHADIMAKLGEFPTEEGWIKGGLDKYGLVAVSPNSHAVQLEKVRHTTFPQYTLLRARSSYCLYCIC